MLIMLGKINVEKIFSSESAIPFKAEFLWQKWYFKSNAVYMFFSISSIFSVFLLCFV